MTLRTTSATRRTVVSRSSDVASTSATSSSSDSTGKRSGLERTELIVCMIAAAFPVPASVGCPLRTVLLSRYNANVGQVAVLLCVVQSVTHHEFIGDLEPDIVAFERKLASGWLVEQRRDLQRSRLVRQQQLLENRERQPCVENIFHHDHVLVFHGLVDVLGQLHFPSRVPSALKFLGRAGPVSVAGDADEIERGVQIDLPREI